VEFEVYSRSFFRERYKNDKGENETVNHRGYHYKGRVKIKRPTVYVKGRVHVPPVTKKEGGKNAEDDTGNRVDKPITGWKTPG